jgi:hypothetical protein
MGWAITPEQGNGGVALFEGELQEKMLRRLDLSFRWVGIPYLWPRERVPPRQRTRADNTQTDQIEAPPEQKPKP